MMAERLSGFNRDIDEALQSFREEEDEDDDA